MRLHRSFLWLLLFAAFLPQFMNPQGAVLPQGYMPERSADGAIAVVVCGSGGVHLIPLKDGADPEKERQRAEPPCAFAGLGGAAVPPPSFEELPFPKPEAVAYAEQAASGLAPSPTRLLPPSTGPPLPA